MQATPPSRNPNRYCDLISHWHKRNGKAMREFLNPARVDQRLFASLVAPYARRQTDGELAPLRTSLRARLLPPTCRLMRSKRAVSSQPKTCGIFLWKNFTSGAKATTRSMQ